MAEQIVIEFTADISKLQPAIEALEAMGQIDKKSGDIFRATNAEYKKREAEVTKLSQAYNNLTEEIAAGGMKEHSEELGKTTDAIVKQKGETENLTKKLRAMVRELSAMKAEGRDNTEQFRQMSREAGKLADDIGDAREQVKVLSSDTKKLDAVAGAFRGLAAGMSIATGASALLGDENKDLQKTLLQVQSAMAILTGVQEVATLVTGQNALKTYILDAAQKAVAVSARVMGTSVATATAVMTAGLSLVVAGVAFLVDYLVTANEETDKLTDKSIERQKRELSIQQRINNLRISLIKKDKERESQELLMAYKREQAELKADLENKKISWENYSITLTYITQKYLMDRDKLDEVYAKKEKERREKVLAKFIETQNKQIDALRIERMMQDQLSADAFEASQREAREAEKQMDAEIAAAIAGDKMVKDIREKQVKEQKEINDQLLQDLEERAAKEYEIQQKSVEKQKELQTELRQFIEQNAYRAAEDTINSIFELQANNREAEFNAAMSMLDKQRDAIVSNEALTTEQREAIEARYEARKRQLQISNWKAQQAAAVNQAIINTALAVTNALATVKPFVPAAIIAASLAGVSGGFQIAKIRSQPMPQFAEGTEFVEGAGTGTSDSITAKLSRGERVVPARTNAEYFDALSVIQNRLIAPELVNTLLTNIAENGGILELPADKIKSLENNSEGIDYNKLSEAMQKGRSVVNIQMNEKGFVKHIQRGLNQSTYHNTKLRLRA